MGALVELELVGERRPLDAALELEGAGAVEGASDEGARPQDHPPPVRGRFAARRGGGFLGRELPASEGGAGRAPQPPPEAGRRGGVEGEPARGGAGAELEGGGYLARRPGRPAAGREAARVEDRGVGEADGAGHPHRSGGEELAARGDGRVRGAEGIGAGAVPSRAVYEDARAPVEEPLVAACGASDGEGAPGDEAAAGGEAEGGRPGPGEGEVAAGDDGDGDPSARRPRRWRRTSASLLRGLRAGAGAGAEARE